MHGNRILGLDVGEKTIGVAVSDGLGWTAQGVTTIRRREIGADLKAVRDLVAEYGVKTIVVGLPLRMDGTEGEQAEKVKAFGRSLEEGKIPLVYWDERLSTVAAERGLLEADLSRAKRRKVVNKMAAVFILQGYLDSLSRGASIL